MHKAHETIWLQVDPDGESYDPEQWGLEDDATWCKDQINANDVKYVRADIAEAELEAARAEIERKMGAGQFVLEQLAAEQAKNMELRDLIAHAQVSSGVCCCGEPMDGHSSPMYCGHSPVDVWDHAVGKLLDAPSDTSALEAIVKKASEVMRRRSMSVAWNNEPDCNGPIEMGIRALPAVTLEDL